MTKEADRESLLQAVEPNCYGDGNVYRGMRSRNSETKIIYTEAKKEWVGLTDDEIDISIYATSSLIKGQAVVEFARAIEAKLKEKNT
jgi:hypothetical protein